VGLTLTHALKKNPNTFPVGCRVVVTGSAKHRYPGEVIASEVSLSSAFRTVRWDSGSTEIVHISRLDQVTPLQELAMTHRARNNASTWYYPGDRVKVWNQGVGTVMVATRGATTEVQLDSGVTVKCTSPHLSKIGPLEELAQAVKAKKNPPKYPKFKVNDIAAVEWVENDKRSTQIGRIVSIEGQYATLLTQRGIVTVERRFLEELPPLEALARVKVNPTLEQYAVSVQKEEGGWYLYKQLGAPSLETFMAEPQIKDVTTLLTETGRTWRIVICPKKWNASVQEVYRPQAKKNPRTPPKLRRGQTVAVKCRDGKERFGAVHGLSTDSVKLQRWIIDFHDGSSGSYHYSDIEPISDLEMLSRTGAKKNPVILYLKGKDAEGVRAGVKNSLQGWIGSLERLRELTEEWGCEELRRDPEYEYLWSRIWYGVRDVTRR